MFDWSVLTSYEVGVVIALISIFFLCGMVYTKICQLVRLKEIELRQKGIISKDDL